jgi:hypothetical protein
MTPIQRIPGIVFYKDGKYYNDETYCLGSRILRPCPGSRLIWWAPEFSFSPKIVSSRGVPFAVRFARSQLFNNGKYRQRSVESVIADIKDYVSWALTASGFHDDNLTVDIKWVERFS